MIPRLPIFAPKAPAAGQKLFVPAIPANRAAVYESLVFRRWPGPAAMTGDRDELRT